MASEGGTDVKELIKTMNPTLHTETFVFGTIPAKSESDYANVLKLFVGFPVEMMFRESEGWSVIVPQTVAQDIQLQSIFPCKKITLNVHSSLEAVGFMAVILGRLKELGIGVNPVSGYYHDHLFVPEGKEVAAIEELKQMAKDS